MVDPSRFELLTSAMSRQRSNQLSYGSVELQPGSPVLQRTRTLAPAFGVFNTLAQNYFAVATRLLSRRPATGRGGGSLDKSGTITGDQAPSFNRVISSRSLAAVSNSRFLALSYICCSSSSIRAQRCLSDSGFLSTA